MKATMSHPLAAAADSSSCSTWHSMEDTRVEVATPVTRPQLSAFRIVAESWHVRLRCASFRATMDFLRSHVVLTLFFVELAFLLGSGILVLLVLGDEVVHAH